MDPITVFGGITSSVQLLETAVRATSELCQFFATVRGSSENVRQYLAGKDA